MSVDGLETQLEYFDYTESDRRLLSALGPLLNRQADALVAGFYRHLLSFEPTRRMLADPDVKERLLLKQRAYLTSLAGPRVDAEYVRSRRLIGEAHERIGLEPGWYLGAYALYLSMLSPLVCAEFGDDAQRSERTLRALQKLVFFDAKIAMETYIERREGELEYLNRELASQSHRLARDFENQGAELRRTTRRAQAAERLASMGTLVAGLAHEIGTPMGVIQGHAKLLESSVEGDQAGWRLRTIREQIGRISRIIESLLNMARPRHSEVRPVDLDAVLDATLSFLAEKFERRHIKVVRSFDPVPSVTGDAERFQQLFLNLFMNATDAMPEGGELRVELLEPNSGGGVLVRVADTGIGIQKADLERIFDPFFTSKEAGHGNGLGLAVAQGIVTDHGGRIEVESVPGEGTEFRIQFLPEAPEA